MTTLSLPMDVSRRLRPNTRTRGVVVLVGAALVMAIGWAETIATMWERWFPAWRGDGALLERLTGGEGYYHHGPLVPLASAMLALGVYRQLKQATGRGWSIDQRPPFRAAGVAAMLLGALLLWAGTVSGVNVMRGLALVLTAVGAIAAFGGRDMLRAYGPAAGLLIFMVPIPMLALVHISSALKLHAAQMGVGIAQCVPGDELHVEGALVYWQGGDAIRAMTIDSTCSGLRGLITMSWLAAVLICHRGGWRRTLALGLAWVPVAIACNVLRVAGLVIIARQFGTHTVHEDTQLHGLIGLAGMGLGVILLCAVDRLCGRPYAQTNIAMPARGGRHRWPSIAAVVTLVIASTGAWAIDPSASPPPAPPQWQRISRQCEMDGAVFSAVDMPTTDRASDNLYGATVVHQRYLDHVGQRGFDLLIVWHPTIASAIHPPDVCLTGRGSQITHCPDGCANTGPIVCARISNDTAAMNMLYAYFDGQDLTSRYTSMRASRLFGTGRGYAMIRLTAPTADRHGITHDELLAAADQLMPMVRDALRGARSRL